VVELSGALAVVRGKMLECALSTSRFPCACLKDLFRFGRNRANYKPGTLLHFNLEKLLGAIAGAAMAS
jgi:hypothetical protein